jgi:hypothetical protein
MGEYSHQWLCEQIIDKTNNEIIFADSDGIVQSWASAF